MARAAARLSFTMMLVLGCGRVNFELARQDSGAQDGQVPDECADGLLNNGESATDCGGPCTACATGQRCNAPGDCQGGVCSNNTCQAPTCVDTVRNGDESDVDCGGSCEAKCAELQGCQSDADCAQASCTAGRCAAPSCTDGITNGGETDVDCGGSCPPCLDGRSCARGSDCASNTCLESACVVATCANAQIDPGETDLDCGGPCGASCLQGQTCTEGRDCAEGVCGGTTCAAPSCSDGVANQDESDVDCGGMCGAICAVGQTCADDADCESGTCISGMCTEAGCRIQGKLYNTTELNPNNPCEECDPAQSTSAWSPSASGSGCDDGAECTASSTCDGSGLCIGTVEPDACYIESQCWAQGESNPDNAQEYCNAELDAAGWSAPSCTDGILNGDEDGPDCGGSCDACASGYNLCSSNADCIDSGWGYRSCCRTGGYCSRYYSSFYCRFSGYN